MLRIAPAVAGTRHQCAWPSSSPIGGSAFAVGQRVGRRAAAVRQRRGEGRSRTSRATRRVGHPEPAPTTFTSNAEGCSTARFNCSGKAVQVRRDAATSSRSRFHGHHSCRARRSRRSARIRRRLVGDAAAGRLVPDHAVDEGRAADVRSSGQSTSSSSSGRDPLSPRTGEAARRTASRGRIDPWPAERSPGAPRDRSLRRGRARGLPALHVDRRRRDAVAAAEHRSPATTGKVSLTGRVLKPVTRRRARRRPPLPAPRREGHGDRAGRLQGLVPDLFRAGPRHRRRRPARRTASSSPSRARW